jgi:hypothetical protein
MVFCGVLVMGFPGRRGWEWYDPVVLALAGAAVYPDKVSEWLAFRTGRGFGWRCTMVIGVVAGAALSGLTFALMPGYPRMRWWSPLVVVGTIAMVRFTIVWIKDILGTDRW